MNVILNSQEFSFNSWNPFLPVLQYKRDIPTCRFPLGLYSLRAQAVSGDTWWHLYPVKYFVQAVFRPGDRDEEVEGRQQMFWEPWKSQSRQKLDTAEGTCCAVTTAFCARNQRKALPKGWCRKGQQWGAREAAKTSKEFHPREEQDLLLSGCSLPCPWSRRSHNISPQPSHTLYLTPGINSGALALK